MESYCPHCENWHSGSCQNIPKNTPIYPFDTAEPASEDFDAIADREAQEYEDSRESTDRCVW